MQISPAQLFLFLLALLGFAVSEINCLAFNFSSFSDDTRSQLILQDSNINLGAIQVTRETANANFDLSNLAGRTLYNKPFRLYSRSKNVSASFDTTFVLNIKNLLIPGGEGLAFIVTGNQTIPDDSHGQWMGIVNSQFNGTSQAQIVAVEFDTRKSYNDDLDSNHVGLDINSIYSVKQVPLSTYGVNLSTGVDLKVRVTYETKKLYVFIGNNTEHLVLSEPIDLSEYLPETVRVGFSASTGPDNFTELNCVKSWNFTGTVIKDGPKRFWIWIVVPVSIALMVAAVICGCYRRGSQKEEEVAFRDLEAVIQGCSTAPIKFHLKELKKATNKFNPKNKLGKGGFGTVYKGTLKNKDVAVKRVSKKSTQGKQEFIAEVTTIGNLHHRNLVKLIGWCYESKEYLLVYEFLPNGSLDRFIFQDSKSGFQEPLGWLKRLDIITGVAQALDYLHNDCEETVLHRDIKASNIMLGSDFNPKLGDFGLARTIKHFEQTHHSTKELAGTPGYMAPECILTGRATVETDVYAFGVLLLEVACGRKPGSQSEENDYSSFIVNWLWELYKVGRILDGADPRLEGDFETGDMQCVLLLGLACCHPNPNKRPSMKTVLQVLSGEAPAPVVPTERPAFIWPPLPPSFKDIDYSLNGTQVNPFSGISGR